MSVLCLTWFWILLQILTELEHSGVGRNKEQSARMLGHLVSNAPRLIRPYMEPILKVWFCYFSIVKVYEYMKVNQAVTWEERVYSVYHTKSFLRYFSDSERTLGFSELSDPLSFLLLQALILKLKDPDPNPAVVISVLATIGELAQVRLEF